MTRKLTKAVQIPVLIYLPVMLYKELFNFIVISPKRKQALPEGNLPAIRLMATIVRAVWCL
jgi:hypothetical protein